MATTVITMTKCTSLTKTFKVRKRISTGTELETSSTLRTPTKRTPNKTLKKDDDGVRNYYSQLESDNDITWNYESESIKQILNDRDLGIDFLSTQEESQDTNRAKQTFNIFVQQGCSSRNIANNNKQCGVLRSPVGKVGTGITNMYRILNNLKQKNESEDRKRSPDVRKKPGGLGTPRDGEFASRYSAAGKTISRCRSDCTPTRKKQASTSYWSDDETDTFSCLEEQIKTVEVAHLTQLSQQMSQLEERKQETGSQKCSADDIRRKREAAIQRRKERSARVFPKSQTMAASNIDAFKKAEIERKRLAAIELRKLRSQRCR